MCFIVHAAFMRLKPMMMMMMMIQVCATSRVGRHHSHVSVMATAMSGELG